LGQSEMKTAKSLLLSLGLAALLPLEAWAGEWAYDRCIYGASDWRERHEAASTYAIVTAKFVSNDAEAKFYTMNVIRSWKTELSGQITIFYGDHIFPGYDFEDANGVYLIGLSRDLAGRLRAYRCSALHESEHRYAVAIRQLEQLSTCPCENLDEQGWYDRADAIVLADITRITEQGTKTLAELEIFRAWKSELPDKLTVLTEDRRSGCGYPVASENAYLLYLRRDENGEYSTGYCSGNSQSAYNRVRWLEDNHVPYTKKRPRYSPTK
jgi:hypothetical protein